MQAAWGNRWRLFDQAWAPLADLRQTDDAYVVEMDLPGVKRTTSASNCPGMSWS
jgi:HSP20 family molecular chaperone IbpA